MPRWRATLQVVVPTALPGILAGVMLAVARIAGETAPLLFTAFGSRFWFEGLRSPVAGLPLEARALAIVNRGSTPLDDRAVLKIDAPAGETLTAVLDLV